MKTKSPHLAQASYERGILTLDLPRAVQPMLWRQEIKNISNVAFWLAAQENGEQALLMKIGTGLEQTVARFRDEPTAADALAAVREIFINGKPRKTFLGTILKLIVIILLVWFFGSLAFQLAAAFALNHNPDAQKLLATPPVTTAPSAPAQSTGP